MGWNVGVLCIKADINEVDNILDIFYKSEVGLCFEEITSVSMGKALGVGHTESWILIVDTLGRFIRDSRFTIELSHKFKLKMFWIAEALIYRDYYFDNIKKGGIKFELKGKSDGLRYLNDMGVKAIDNWGETIIFQIIEKEIFDKCNHNFDTSLMNLRYAKYELD